MELGEALSKRIDELLFKNNMSMYRLSKISGIPQSTLKNFYNKHTKSPSLAVIYKLADAFNMTYLEFLDCPIFRNKDDLDYV